MVIQSDRDPCLYTKQQERNLTFFLAWIDIQYNYTLSFYLDQNYKMLCHLNKEAEIKAFGIVTFYLGIQTEKEDGSYLLSQRLKTMKLLESRGPKDANQ